MTKREIAALLASYQDLQTKYHLELDKNSQLRSQNEELARRLAWFECKLFGQKSERRLLVSCSKQLWASCLLFQRQEQRLEVCGIHISRATLINLTVRVSLLLKASIFSPFSLGSSKQSVGYG